VGVDVVGCPLVPLTLREETHVTVSGG
jgi:hypothetical protein